MYLWRCCGVKYSVKGRFLEGWFLRLFKGQKLTPLQRPTIKTPAYKSFVKFTAPKGHDEKVSKKDVDRRRHVDQRRPLTCRKAQSARHRPVENLSLVDGRRLLNRKDVFLNSKKMIFFLILRCFLLVDVDQ